MSYLLSADLHIDKHRQFDTIGKDKKSSRLCDGLNSLKWLYETALAKKCEHIILAGDLFHTRHKIEVEVFNAVFNLIAGATEVHWHILAGNHDQYTEKVTSIEPLGYLGNVTTYIDSQRVLLSGNTFDFIPYKELPKDYLSSIDDLGSPHEDVYCITHVSLDGATVGSFEHRPKADMYLSYYPEYYKRILAGHYHKPQTLGKFTYLGSLIQLDRSDIGQDKSALYLTSEGEEELIYYDKSPCFISMKWSDISKRKNVRSIAGNFIDVLVDVHPYPAMTEISETLKNYNVRSYLSIYDRKKNTEIEIKDVIKTARTSPQEAIRNYVVVNQKSKRFTAAGIDLLERGKQAK